MNSTDQSILLTQRLIKSKSVTPKDDGAMNTLKKSLVKIGFKNKDLPFVLLHFTMSMLNPSG